MIMNTKKILNKHTNSRLANLDKLFRILNKNAFNNFNRNYRIRLVLPEFELEIDHYEALIRADVTISPMCESSEELQKLESRIKFYKSVVKDLRKKKAFLEKLLEDK